MCRDRKRIAVVFSVTLLISSLTSKRAPGDPLDPPSNLPGVHDELRLKLVYRLDLDRKHRAGKGHSPGDTPPPELLTSGALPPISVEQDAIVFLDDRGRIAREVALSQDRNVAEEVLLSPAGTAVAVGRTFSPVVIDDEKAEGGESEAVYTVYDRSGTITLRTTQTSADMIRVTDSGAAAFVNLRAGLITLIDRVSGERVSRFQLLGPYSSARPRFGMSEDGNRIMVAASTTSLDGVRGPEKLRNEEDYYRRALRETWVSLFDGAGTELWRKQLPGLCWLENAALSADGTRVFVQCDESGPGPLKESPHLGYPGFLLDGSGNVVTQSEEWGLGAFGARWENSIGGFVLGDRLSPALDIVHGDGSLETVFEDSWKHPFLKDVKIQDRSVRPDRVALLVFRRRRLLLLLMNPHGKILLVRNVWGPPCTGPGGNEDEPGPEEGPVLSDVDRDQNRLPDEGQTARVTLSSDSRFVTLRLSGEVRVFEILAKGSSRKGGRP